MKLTQITSASTVQEIEAALRVGQVECRETDQWWECHGRLFSLGTSSTGSWSDVAGYTRAEAAQYIADEIAMATA